MPAWTPLRCRLAALACMVLGGNFAISQDAPIVRIAFRAGAADAGPLGIAWLCGTYLPSRQEWPAELAAKAAFTATVSAAGLRIEASQMALPEGTLAAGSLQFGDHPMAFGACDDDGIEDWYVPKSMQLPAPWRTVLHELDADLIGQPRTLDIAVLVGHLAGPTMEGDSRHGLAHLGAVCG